MNGRKRREKVPRGDLLFVEAVESFFSLGFVGSFGCRAEERKSSQRTKKEEKEKETLWAVR